MKEPFPQLTLTDYRGVDVRVNQEAWRDFVDTADMWPDITMQVYARDEDRPIDQLDIDNLALKMGLSRSSLVELPEDLVRQLCVGTVSKALNMEKGYRIALAHETLKSAILPIASVLALIGTAGYMSVLDDQPRYAVYEAGMSYLFGLGGRASDSPLTELVRARNNPFMQELGNVNPFRHRIAHQRGHQWLQAHGSELFV